MNAYGCGGVRDTARRIREQNRFGVARARLQAGLVLVAMYPVTALDTIGELAMSKTMTTSAGVPVADNQNSITAGPRGPVLADYWTNSRRGFRTRCSLRYPSTERR